jgi:hypothetical protein
MSLAIPTPRGRACAAAVFGRHSRPHHEVTGVPPYIARVQFVEAEPASVFTGGAPLDHGRLFAPGWTRWVAERHRSTGHPAPLGAFGSGAVC